MQPSGTVGLVGFATNALFLRDALDKAGLEAQFVARGEYKSAANLFTQDSYTEAHREADSRLIGSLHSQVWQAVAESRHLEPAEIDALADKAPVLRDDAVTGRLVDRIGFRDEAYAPDRRTRWRTGHFAGTGDADSDPTRHRGCTCRAMRAPPHPASTIPSIPGRKTQADHRRGHPGRADRQRPRRPATARRSGTRVPAGTPSPRHCGKRPPMTTWSAIVLRVNSPGGSVTGSETIWREVVRARDGGKPVVASMGAVAASGGYYVSMARRRDRRQPGYHHRIDRRGDRQAGRP